uniref:Secreted protein n=1 Tax=Panstrongylus lignarius TaxID=156445 RepID=A0A224XKK4_9HEMI
MGFLVMLSILITAFNISAFSTLCPKWHFSSFFIDVSPVQVADDSFSGDSNFLTLGDFIGLVDFSISVFLVELSICLLILLFSSSNCFGENDELFSLKLSIHSIFLSVFFISNPTTFSSPFSFFSGKLLLIRGFKSSKFIELLGEFFLFNELIGSLFSLTSLFDGLSNFKSTEDFLAVSLLLFLISSDLGILSAISSKLSLLVL